MDDYARLLRDAQRVLQRYGVESGGSGDDLRLLRAVLEEHLFDGDERCRDDVAEIAMKIDDVLLEELEELSDDVGGGGAAAA